MSKVDSLLQNFEKVMQESWTGVLSLEERMYFLVYDPAEQRKIDLRISDFENVTCKSGKKWVHVTLEGLFSEWMANNEYRDAYFEEPEVLIDQLEGVFKDYILNFLKEKISSAPQEKDVLIAVTDITALFGFCRLSDILNSLDIDFPGRLLLFFPGEFEKNHYRLLDARDGWNYLARPITI